MAKLDIKVELDETLVLAVKVATRRIEELEAELALSRTPSVSECKHYDAYIASTYGHRTKVHCDTCGGKASLYVYPDQRNTNEEIIAKGKLYMIRRKRIWGS